MAESFDSYQERVTNWHRWQAEQAAAAEERALRAQLIEHVRKAITLTALVHDVPIGSLDALSVAAVDALDDFVRRANRENLEPWHGKSTTNG